MICCDITLCMLELTLINSIISSRILCSRWHLTSVVAYELDVNKSHLWQYLIVGLGQDFYLTDSERETLYNNLLEVNKAMSVSEESYTLLRLLSRVSFRLNQSMFINISVDACSWDFGARRIPCQADWFRPTLTLHGNCYTFNYDGRFSQLSSGPGAGLRLIMNVHTDFNSGKPHSSLITQLNAEIHAEILTCEWTHWILMSVIHGLLQYNGTLCKQKVCKI